MARLDQSLRIPIRWRIFVMLFGFGFVAYVQRESLTIAAVRMMPELHLTQLQMGWIEQAFVLGYAIFQLPGGILGQRWGARRTLAIMGLLAFLSTALTALAPQLLLGTGLFMLLMALQLTLGVAQAATFRSPPACSKPGSRRNAGRWCRGCRPWAWVWARPPRQ